MSDVIERAVRALDELSHYDAAPLWEIVPELITEVERLKEELEVLHPAVLYHAVFEQLSRHRWSHTYVLQGQFCNCGFNGDHENHLALCIVRAVEAMRVEL